MRILAYFDCSKLPNCHSRCHSTVQYYQDIIINRTLLNVCLFLFMVTHYFIHCREKAKRPIYNDILAKELIQALNTHCKKVVVNMSSIKAIKSLH